MRSPRGVHLIIYVLSYNNIICNVKRKYKIIQLSSLFKQAFTTYNADIRKVFVCGAATRYNNMKYSGKNEVIFYKCILSRYIIIIWEHVCIKQMTLRPFVPPFGHGLSLYVRQKIDNSHQRKSENYSNTTSLQWIPCLAGVLSQDWHGHRTHIWDSHQRKKHLLPAYGSKTWYIIGRHFYEKLLMFVTCPSRYPTCAPQILIHVSKTP